MKSRLLQRLVTGIALLSATSLAHAEFSGNINISNNYIWRGLTQTNDEPAISGGLDWAHDSGFYIGTWVSNVQYASDDAFSYEHDIYAGYAGEYNGVSYDIGYLYYNYNEEAKFDFSEIYASLGYGGFSATAFVFVHTQADATPLVADAEDFANSYYISLDYGFEIPQLEGWEFGLHGGYHEGDFVDLFNFSGGAGPVVDSYFDYNASISKGGFSFMVSGTDLNAGDTGPSLNNDDLKFVVGYSVDF